MLLRVAEKATHASSEVDQHVYCSKSGGVKACSCCRMSVCGDHASSGRDTAAVELTFCLAGMNTSYGLQCKVTDGCPQSS